LTTALPPFGHCSTGRSFYRRPDPLRPAAGSRGRRPSLGGVDPQEGVRGEGGVPADSPAPWTGVSFDQYLASIRPVAAKTPFPLSRAAAPLPLPPPPSHPRVFDKSSKRTTARSNRLTGVLILRSPLQGHHRGPRGVTAAAPRSRPTPGQMLVNSGLVKYRPNTDQIPAKTW
jgi:hypothetical protein